MHVKSAVSRLVGEILTERLRDETVGRNTVAVLAAELEVDTRGTRAGGESERPCELDTKIGQFATSRRSIEREYLQIGRGDVVAGTDRLLKSDDLVETTVRVEARLDVGKGVD